MNTLIMGPTGCGKTYISNSLKYTLMKDTTKKTITQVVVCSDPPSSKQVHKIMQDLYNPSVEVIIEMSVDAFGRWRTEVEERIGSGVCDLLDRLIEIYPLQPKRYKPELTDADIMKHTIDVLSKGPNSLAFVYYLVAQEADTHFSSIRFDKAVLKLCEAGLIISSSGTELDPATVLSLVEEK